MEADAQESAEKSAHRNIRFKIYFDFLLTKQSHWRMYWPSADLLVRLVDEADLPENAAHSGALWARVFVRLHSRLSSAADSRRCVHSKAWCIRRSSVGGSRHSVAFGDGLHSLVWCIQW